MLRQKFIDRLRKKYQTGGTSESNVPVIGKDDTSKASSLALKLAKWGPLAGTLAGRAIAPFAAMFGAHKAYAPSVTDSTTGVNTYTG